MRHVIVIGTLAVVVASGSSGAAVSLVSQQRSISATTSFDANTQTAAAPDFAPFVTTVTSNVAFPIGGGSTNFNVAATTINCTVDPNDIRASGVMQAAGGVAVAAGSSTTVEGEAGVIVVVTFDVVTATPFRLTCQPRPSTDPRDEFQLEFSADNGGGGVGEFVRLTELDPAQAVDITGELLPGRYTLQYQLEYTQGGQLQDASYGLVLLVPSPGGAGVLGVGVLLLSRRRR